MSRDRGENRPTEGLPTRLFVAAWPSVEARRELHRIDRPAEHGVRWVPPENWHVTLRFVGDASPDEVAERLARASLPMATARLGPFVERLDRQQLVVPVAGVDELAAAVVRATDGVGEPARHEFRGHLTVARLRPGASSAVEGTPVDANFEVVEVALVASDLTPAGAVYTTVATFSTR